MCIRDRTLSDYWADVRLRYSQFEAGIKNPSTDIYRYEMPGDVYKRQPYA